MRKEGDDFPNLSQKNPLYRNDMEDFFVPLRHNLNIDGHANH